MDSFGSPRWQPDGIGGDQVVAEQFASAPAEAKPDSVGPRTAELLAGWPGLRRLRHLPLFFNNLPKPVMEPLRPHFGIRLCY
jgi:hypothetical protein